ncbi:unnamed protein product [Penicillium salamii]|nr:unnamed protein product [Penicillium salamii]
MDKTLLQWTYARMTDFIFTLSSTFGYSFIVTFALILTLLAIVILINFLGTRLLASRLHADHAPKSRFDLVLTGGHNVTTRARGVECAKKATKTSDSHSNSTEDEQYVNWVSDFLPHDLPHEIRKDVRIFFYNYDSYWKRDAIYTRLSTIANGLLEQIDSKLSQSQRERSRPLIFVTHSYGGLVVKEALVQAKRRRELNHLVGRTKAILFLGAPHRGSTYGLIGWITAIILRPVGSNHMILGQMNYDAQELSDLHENFIASTQDDLKVINFYEQRPQHDWVFWQAFTVAESSATYHGKNVRKIALPVDHKGLNKFGSRNEFYEIIRSKLVEIMWPLIQPAKSIYHVPVREMQNLIQRDQLWEDLQEKLQIRHENASVPYAVTLYGLGGAGKSMLALKYAESKKTQYDPIFWIDATNEDTIRSRFSDFAKMLGLPSGQNNGQGTALVDDPVIQSVLRWFQDRTEMDREWLVIIDNADDFKSGIKHVIPRGHRGRLIITSRDEQSQKLVYGGCEPIRVDVMSAQEARSVLLQRLSRDISMLPRVEEKCDEIAQKLGYLALAIDLAGAYIASGPEDTHEEALIQYSEDFEWHRDELLKMKNSNWDTPAELNVWAVWDTTLGRIEREYAQFHPGLLLTFLAWSKSTIFQDELFRLASLGISDIDKNLGDILSSEFRQFISAKDDSWDSFLYRKSLEILIRYSLVQRVHGDWPGTTMHSLVQWRAMHRYQSEPWKWYHSAFIFAASSKTANGGQGMFRRHLIAHLPSVDSVDLSWMKNPEVGKDFIWRTLAKIYGVEYFLGEAEKLGLQLVELRKKRLGEDHPSTLESTLDLAFTYRDQLQWDKTESLQAQVMDRRIQMHGETHPDTLKSMSHLVTTYMLHRRWEEAENLHIRMMKICKQSSDQNGCNTPDDLRVLGVIYEHQERWEGAERVQAQEIQAREKVGEKIPEALQDMDRLAKAYGRQGRWDEMQDLEVRMLKLCKETLGEIHDFTFYVSRKLGGTYQKQGHWEKAEEVQIQTIHISKKLFGEYRQMTTLCMKELAETYENQGRWEDAEDLQVKVIQIWKVSEGEDNFEMLKSIGDLAEAYQKQGRWKEAEDLQVHVMQKFEKTFGNQHPSTIWIQSSLGWTYQNQGRWEEAEKLQAQAAQISIERLGKRSTLTSESIRRLSLLYYEQGRREEGRKLKALAIEMRAEAFGICPNIPIAVFPHPRVCKTTMAG